MENSHLRRIHDSKAFTLCMEMCSTAARDSATAGWAFEDEEWQDENGSSPTGAPHKTPHVSDGLKRWK